MHITQTVQVPTSHRLIIDVPPEIPSGMVEIRFIPIKAERKIIPGFGCAKGQFRMSDDFDAPLEDFKDYM